METKEQTLFQAHPLKMLNNYFFAHFRVTLKFSEALRQVNEQLFKEKFWIWGP